MLGHIRLVVDGDRPELLNRRVGQNSPAVGIASRQPLAGLVLIRSDVPLPNTGRLGQPRVHTGQLTRCSLAQRTAMLLEPSASMAFALTIIDTYSTPPRRPPGDARDTHRRERAPHHGLRRGDEAELTRRPEAPAHVEAHSPEHDH